jgi:cysteine desulfurase
MRYYFDHNATTPVAREVLEVYRAALADDFGNASSIHQDGQRARQALESARRAMAQCLHCDARELVLLSGGTEANNLALAGLRPRHIVTSTIEHPAVLNPCAVVERQGVAVTYVPVDRQGLVDPRDVARALRPDTGVVSIMHANNETGAVQPIAEIARITRAAGVPLHVDGVQAAGKLEVDLHALGADLYSISAHKLYAPKGVGLLYVRQGVQLTALLHGGRHERERRAGTENVAGAVALAAALRWFQENGPAERARLAELRDHLEREVLRRVEGVHVNSGAAPRVPNTTNLRFDAIEGEPLVIALDLAGFAISSGSACSSGAVEPSHVLLAMGLSRDEARASIRISLGRANDRAQVDALVEALVDAVARLRKVSTQGPVYVR